MVIMNKVCEPAQAFTEVEIAAVKQWQKLGCSLVQTHPLVLPKSTEQTLDSLEAVVLALIRHFRSLIEQADLWKLCRNDGEALEESALRDLFFALANAYCEANELNLRPAHGKAGTSVQFVFVESPELRYNLEIKRSDTVKLAYWYVLQSENGKKIEGTERSACVLVEFDDNASMRNLLTQLYAESLNACGKPPRLLCVSAAGVSSS